MAVRIHFNFDNFKKRRSAELKVTSQIEVPSAACDPAPGPSAVSEEVRAVEDTGSTEEVHGAEEARAAEEVPADGEADTAADARTAEEDSVLRSFLDIPISSPDEVFARFRTLPGAVEAHGGVKQGYLYVPGTRADRCVLVAHADTYYDLAYMGAEYTNRAVLEDGVYRGTVPGASIGADDRAGCAMQWLLRASGHSLLIVDGEEHGQIGSHFLMDRDPALFREINGHSFILQLDRRGSSDLRFYDIPVTPEFSAYIREQTGYLPVYGPGKTDVRVLCRDVCGVNLSIGYHCEHRPFETLVVEEWRHTLRLVEKMLAGPQRRYPIAGSRAD